MARRLAGIGLVAALTVGQVCQLAQAVPATWRLLQVSAGRDIALTGSAVAAVNWFSQALGFDQSNWQDLASQLYFDPATAVPTKTTQYGQTYEQVIPITGANGKTIDATFVFMKDNSGTVRLVTGIPAKK